MKSYAAYDDHMLEKGGLQCSPAPDDKRPDPLGQESKLEGFCKLTRTLHTLDYSSGLCHHLARVEGWKIGSKQNPAPLQRTTRND